LKSKRNIFLRFSAVFYFTVLLYIVFFARRRRHVINFREKINLEPFLEKVNYISHPIAVGTQYDFYSNLIGNIILFIPFSFAFCWLTNKQYSNQFLFLVIVLTSLVIETLQYVFNKGVADIDDVILNSLGDFLGLLLFKKINFKIQNQ
jgi:glycopeptide antibiotics resistance protein